MRSKIVLTMTLLLLPAGCRVLDSKATAAAIGKQASISPQQMQAIYEEVKTPFKYGIVIDPPEGKKVDCPTVFRHRGKWYMIYVELQRKPEQGYTTQLAVSDDLLHWKPQGVIGQRGKPNSWDSANVGGGLALCDTAWNGTNGLETFRGRYWFSYIGGHQYGYEITPLSIGLASTSDAANAEPWDKLPDPIMKPDDPDARQGQETTTLYKSFIFRDRSKILGKEFVMFYNAKGDDEKIFTAVSDDMITWKRFGENAAIENPRPAGVNSTVISGDPQIVRIGDIWVMFYFGAFWKPGAFNTFAASKDLVHWTKWTGEDLMKPSEPFDAQYAHKPWFIKHDGVVYQFYCAVDKNGYRSIALATSRGMK